MTIYVCSHSRPEFKIQDKHIVQILVDQNEQTYSDHFLTDNSQDNISQKNGQYCELTAMYWIWKNDNASEFKGLFHYSRYLDLREASMRDTETPIFLRTESSKDIYVSKSYCIEKMNSYDLILPKPINLKYKKFTNNREEFEKSDNHDAKIYNIILNVIQKYFPEYIASFREMSASNYFYPCNIFIAKADIFDSYCEWLFDVLLRVEEKYGKPTKDRQLGYIGERLLHVYFLHLLNRRPDLKYTCVDLIKIDEQMAVVKTLNRSTLGKLIRNKMNKIIGSICIRY